MTKFAKIAIAFAGYLVFFSNVPLVQAGPCADAGGNCYQTDCSGQDATTNGALNPTSATANTGCVNMYGAGYVCCTVSGVSAGSDNTKGKAASAGTVTILGQSIDTNSLTGFLQVAVAVAQWIEAIVGSLALLMFVYGGFVLLLSQGSSDKVTKGKSIIVGAVIGLIIVFASWSVINFIMSGLGNTAAWNVSK